MASELTNSERHFERIAVEWRTANVILGSVESDRHARRLCPIYDVYVRKRVAYFILFAPVVPLVGLLSAAQTLGCLGQNRVLSWGGC